MTQAALSVAVWGLLACVRPHPRLHTHTLTHTRLFCTYAESTTSKNDRAESWGGKEGRGKPGCDVCIRWGVIPGNKVMWVAAERGRSLRVVYAECIDYDIHVNFMSDNATRLWGGPNEGPPGISGGCHSLLDCRAEWAVNRAEENLCNSSVGLCRMWAVLRLTMNRENPKYEA